MIRLSLVTSLITNSIESPGLRCRSSNNFLVSSSRSDLWTRPVKHWSNSQNTPNLVVPVINPVFPSPAFIFSSACGIKACK